MNLMKETVRGIELIPLEDELLNKRELFLIDEVDTRTTSALIMQLKYLDSVDPHAPITLFINSPGGEVYSGLALYDVIKAISAPVNTVCIGTAASMSAIIFLAGRKRQMYPHARLMIHDPAYGSGSIAGRKSHELKHQLDKLNETREALAKIIADATKKSLDEIYEITAEDTYFSAEEALEFKLSTGIIAKKRKRGN